MADNRAASFVVYHIFVKGKRGRVKISVPRLLIYGLPTTAHVSFHKKGDGAHKSGRFVSIRDQDRRDAASLSSSKMALG